MRKTGRAKEFSAIRRMDAICRIGFASAPSMEAGGGIAVMLIPARTDTKAFHEYIYGKAEIRFIKGRLRFGGSKNSAPFPSMIVVFDKKGVKA